MVARSAKFSLFDPAKEMVYIEMDREEKQQGKAAVDLVGSQAGIWGRGHSLAACCRQAWASDAGVCMRAQFCSTSICRVFLSWVSLSRFLTMCVIACVQVRAR